MTTRTRRTRSDQRLAPSAEEDVARAGQCSQCGTAVCGACMGGRYPYWLWHEVLPRAGGDTVGRCTCGRCEDVGGMHYVGPGARRTSSFVEI